MKRKKLTPEELRELRKRHEEAKRTLEDRIQRINAELGAGEVTSPRDAQRLLEERIQLITAELEARQKPA